MSELGDQNVRIQILMAPRSAARLNKLVKETESTSSAEVVRNALRLYESVIDASKAGRSFYQEIDGRMTPIVMTGPYATPKSDKTILMSGTQAEFEANGRSDAIDELGYVTTDTHLLYSPLNGRWHEWRLEQNPSVDVGGFDEFEIKAIDDVLIVRMDGTAWRTLSDQTSPEMDTFGKRFVHLLNNWTKRDAR